jgi:hypothetical protein
VRRRARDTFGLTAEYGLGHARRKGYESERDDAVVVVHRRLLRLAAT